MNPSQNNNDRQNAGASQTKNPGGTQLNPGAGSELPNVNGPQDQQPSQQLDGINAPQAGAPGSTNRPANPKARQAAQSQPPAPGGKQPKAQPVKSNPDSTQNNLQIAEIRDGIVIMNDGSFRSVVMAKSINFDLMSPAEREGVELGFQNFLNSLYFPIQIFIRSQKVDLGPYIEKLDKIRTEHDNMLLALLMDDYINYIDQLASQTNIMDKHFYVVVPFFPKKSADGRVSTNKGLLSGMMGIFGGSSTHLVINEADLATAKTELKNRVQAVLGGLMECSVKGIPLDTQELIELYYDSYNPDTATRQELKDFTGMNTPVVTKGKGDAKQPNLDKELS